MTARTMQHQHLGTTFSPTFLAAMMQEGGRVEADAQQALHLSDWILTYLNL